MNKKELLKPYMRQFYRGNGWRFALALLVTLFLTASALMVSWLLQVIIDMATGADVGFSFAQVVLLTVIGVFLEAFAGCWGRSAPPLADRRHQCSFSRLEN